MKKQIVSMLLVLALVMVISILPMIPVTVSAAVNCPYTVEATSVLYGSENHSGRIAGTTVYGYSRSGNSVTIDFCVTSNSGATYLYDGSVTFTDNTICTSKYSTSERVSYVSTVVLLRISRPAMAHTGTATCAVASACTLCGDTYKSTNHYNLSGWQIEGDKHWRVCNDCGQRVSEASHTYSEATCTAASVCTACNDLNTSALGHSYTNGIYCERCGLGIDGTRYISTKEQLVAFKDLVNGGQRDLNAVLMADIDMTGEYMFPIAQTSAYNKSGSTVTDSGYSGTFDGNGHVISNLIMYVMSSSSGDIKSWGLFGTLSGTVKNLGMENFSVQMISLYGTLDCRVGAIAGQVVSGGVISDCYVANSKVPTESYVAGAVAGCNYGGTIERCISYSCEVTGAANRCGSIVGDCQDDGGGKIGTVNDCWTDGERAVSSQSTAGKITNCNASVSADMFASGEITYRLNGFDSDGVWKQTLEADSHPNFKGSTVYAVLDICSAANAVSFNNESGSLGDHDSSIDYVNGICPNGCYEPAKLNEDESSDHYGCYQIGNAGQLIWFAELVNSGEKTANAILIDDIDMDGIDWTPICSTGLYYNTTTYTDKGYEGTFDGGGHTISNLKITGTDGVKASYGLFGTLSGTVKNLGMSGMTFSYADTYDTNTTDTRAGAIAGQMLDGSLISDCFVVDSSLTPNNYIVGGIAGCNYAGTIQNCYTKNVTISAHNRCGNLVSDTRGDISTTDRPGTVKNCYTDASRVVGTNTSGSEYITGCVANIPDSILDSGEIAYKLNGDRTETVWYQKDGMPAFSGSIVYKNTCGGDIFYSTTDGDYDSHNIGADLRCTNCGSYEPATLVTAENCSDLGLDESYIGYYAIKNASNLYWYSERERIGNIGGSIVLLNDITLDNSKAEWIPIGWDGDCIFDGRGNTITLNLDYGNEQDTGSYGLFGTCNYSVVKNLFLDGNIKANTTGNVGAVAASMYRTTVSGVISTVNVTNTCTTGGNIGGLAGYFGGKHDTTNNQYSKIENCAVYADVTGYNAGGLVGQGWNGTQYWDITNAAYVGNVTTTNTTNGLAGAIVGYQATDTGTSTFTNIYWFEEDGIGFYGLRDTENQVYTNTSAKTAEQFASGEVAYLLQGEQETHIWGQSLGTDDLPVLSGAKVYYGYITCDITQTDLVYTNREVSEERPPHTEGTAATCTTQAVCLICSAQYGELGAHAYTNGFCNICDAYQPATGSGTAADPYQIGNAGQLYWFADKVNNDNGTYGSADAILTADIKVNENVLKSDGTLNGDGSNFRVWTPIGKTNNSYTGTFDGNGKTVSGLYFNDRSSYYVGLLGNVDSGGFVSNVGVVDSYLVGRQHVGGVVGLSKGTVTNCYSAGTVNGSDRNIGGVVGGNTGTVSNCYNTGIVGGYGYVGGVVGTNSVGNVINCYNTGSVKGSSVYTGGVAGINADGTITNCYYLDTAFDGGIKGEDVGGSAEAMSEDDFASGEVAYLLQGEQETHIWGQNLATDSYPILGGPAVYTFINCNNWMGFANRQKETGEHSYAGGICTGCGLTNKVHSWSITLDDSIAVNFLLKLDSADAVVKLTVGDTSAEYTAADMTQTDGLYKLSVKLAAAQMTQNISVTVCDGEETVFTKTYTVRQYCDTILADESNAEYHALVKEMLNYGAAAQAYFGFDTENLANDGITDAAAQDIPESAEAMTVSDKISGLDFYGATLSHRDRIAVRYYFTGNVTGCSFTANGKTYTPVAKDGMYYVEIPDIFPQNLDQQITLTVTDANGKILSVTYSPMNYIVRMNEKGTDTLKNLLKALYNYHLAAKALNT